MLQETASYDHINFVLIPTLRDQKGYFCFLRSSMFRNIAVADTSSSLIFHSEDLKQLLLKKNQHFELFETQKPQAISPLLCWLCSGIMPLPIMPKFKIMPA